jgi:antitoxin ParD1/3/4
MNVSMTPELEEFVAHKVESGRYTSAREVVREALRLLEEQDQARNARLAEFNRILETRLAASDRGELVDPQAARERLRRKSEEARRGVGEAV